VIRIEVAVTGRSGFVLAIDTAATPATAQVVGQAYRTSLDTEPETWKAWLWDTPGIYPPSSQSTQTVTAKGKPAELREKLTRRHQAKGAWWTSADRGPRRLAQATRERTGRTT